MPTTAAHPVITTVVGPLLEARASVATRNEWDGWDFGILNVRCVRIVMDDNHVNVHVFHRGGLAQTISFNGSHPRTIRLVIADLLEANEL